MESFLEYLTSNHCEALCRLLAKERIKQGASKKMPRNTKLFVQTIMPYRNDWVRLRKKTRAKDLSKETAGVLVIKKTIASHRKAAVNGITKSTKYLAELDKYTAKLTGMVSGELPISFSAEDFAILPKFKGDEGKDTIYRPLCVYNNLDTKTLISAASAYFTQHFDEHLHEEILSYRPRRMYHGVKTNTSGADAIKAIREYLDKHKQQNIYVAECDIQKFYDIINHDVVLDCFDTLALKAGIPEYGQIRRVLKAYLDSYGFVPNILNLNENKNYWYQPSQRHRGKIEGSHMFKWVKEEDFLLAYTEEEFAQVRNQLGVPQGGALSCVISNVVLNDVDQAILSEKDDDTLFVRYGDDIILMHTDKEKCEHLLELYKQSLTDHKLIYHRFEDFAGLKDGEKNTKKFWKGKSKPVFLWGPGPGNASEWIGFVGYEFHRNGYTRLRISTIDKKFGAINKAYHKCLESKAQDPSKIVEKARKRMESLPSSMDKFTELQKNDYLFHQLKNLDRYRFQKLKKLDTALSKRCNEKVNLTEYFESDDSYSFFRTKYEKTQKV